MSKNLTENYPIVDTVEALEERLAGVREAQRIFATYTQIGRASCRERV